MRFANTLTAVLLVLLTACGGPAPKKQGVIGTWSADRARLLEQAQAEFDDQLAVADDSDKATIEAAKAKRLAAVEQGAFRLTLQDDGKYVGEALHAATGKPIVTNGTWMQVKDKDKWVLTPASPDQGRSTTLRFEGNVLVAAEAGDGLVVHFVRE